MQAEQAGQYRDLTPGNAGEAFRAGDLDVYSLTAHSGQPGSGTGQDFYVGDVMATERLEYAVTFSRTGRLTLALRYGVGTTVNGTTTGVAARPIVSVILSKGTSP